MDEAQKEPAPGSRIQHLGEAILLIVGAYLAASLAVTVFDPLITAVVGASASPNTVRIIQTVIQFVTMIAVVVGYVRLVDTERLIRAIVPSGRNIGLILGGTVALLGGQYLINRLLDAVDLAPGANQAVLAGAGDPLYYLVMVVVSLLFVGPAEELLFRGAVQGRLRESWGSWPAIVTATVLFGVIHIPAVSGGFGAKLSYALLAGVLGIVLGYLYEYTDNIVVPAVTHGCYNGTLFAVLYLGEIGYIG